MTDAEPPPYERVSAERRRRGWSARTAAKQAGISNTTWSEFEKCGEVTSRIRQAVADAFEWPADWPEQMVPTELAAQQQLVAATTANQQSILDKLDELLDELRQHRQVVEPDGGVDDVLARLTEAVELVTRQQRDTPTGMSAESPAPRQFG
jgi:transcriptional regulator with XRE-family HTH domain